MKFSVAVIVLLVAAVQAQTAKVVPVDLPTAANLSVLEKRAKDAQNSYDEAVAAAKRRLLTARGSAHSTGRGQSCFAFREGDEGPFGTSISGSSYGSSYLFALSTSCETAEEKVKREKADKAAKAERAKWESEHPERYWLEGFCEGAEFTDDYHYLVPKTPPTALHNGPLYLNPAGITATPAIGWSAQ